MCVCQIEVRPDGVINEYRFSETLVNLLVTVELVKLVREHVTMHLQYIDTKFKHAPAKGGRSQPH